MFGGMLTEHIKRFNLGGKAHGNKNIRGNQKN